jgi:hypothetical protein
MTQPREVLHSLNPGAGDADEDGRFLLHWTTTTVVGK